PNLARMVGVNQTKLKAGFREVFGVTIYDFIIQQRMRHASQLLLTSEYSVSEVAYQTGYEYPANFTCAFKKYFGALPSNWKRP
ncbi:MAG: helix-turn-helix domain-containing protein, partial [Sphingopyxis sp.]